MVNFRHLAGSAVVTQRDASRITVEDCISQAPVSEIGGYRRRTFLCMGEQCLFQRCYSEQGMHDLWLVSVQRVLMPSYNVMVMNRWVIVVQWDLGVQDCSSIM